MPRLPRRRFLQLAAAGASTVRAAADPTRQQFVIATQFTPLPSGKGWRGEKPPLGRAMIRATLDTIREHGFNGIEYPVDLPPEDVRELLEYVRSLDMVLVWQAGEMELFGRDKPPAVPIFSPEYAQAVRAKIGQSLRKKPSGARVLDAFCYQDEPFHLGPQSFDYGPEIRAEFRRRYGYDLPPDIDSIRNDTKKWLDVLNFRSDTFAAAWREVYRIIKEIDPGFRVVMTHDSHSTFGAGVGSNGKLAIDDVYHWGGDFADMFVFDIYPYMMYDFRYGECGRLRQPRISQTHYAFAQMRNLTRAYGKDLGFWFGTYNKRWFRRYVGPERQATVWAEREMIYTAVAQGADFLLSGINIPEDARHWDPLADALRPLQRVGAELIAAPKVKAKACFLFPRAQYLQLQEEYWNVGLSFELFLRSFGELDVLHEEQVRDETLEGYSLLVLCDVTLVPRAVADRIAAFAERGGVVVADCVPVLDEYRFPTDAMEKFFGVLRPETRRLRRTGVWAPQADDPHWFIPTDSAAEEAHGAREIVEGHALGRQWDFIAASPRSTPVRRDQGADSAEVLLTMQSGKPSLLRRKIGRGRAYLLGFCLQDAYFRTYKEADAPTRGQLHQLLRAICSDGGVAPHVHSSNPEVEASLRANHSDGFLFVINHEAAEPVTEVAMRDIGFEIRRIVDLRSGRRLPSRRDGGSVVVDLEVALETPRVFRLLG